jgi:hypothetical protein
MIKQFAAFAAVLALSCPAWATVTNGGAPAVYTCNGTTTSFTVPWSYVSSTHVAATVKTGSIVTTLTQPTNFTVKPTIAPTTGTLTLTTACANGSTLTISRVVPLTQPQSFRTGSYQGPIHEQAMDRIEMQVQQNANTHAADKVTQAAKDASQDAALSTGAVGGNSTLITSTGTTAARSLAARGADVIKVRDFTGVVANDTNDDTAGIQAAITAAAASSKALSFCPAATYKFTSQLVFSGVNVDFCGSNMHWAGPVGVFAMVLDSSTNSGVTGTTGNTFDNLTLYQSDFAAYTTATGSTTYDPPSIGAGSAISNITPGGVSTTVAATGATVGGYARATFSNVADGIRLTARVTALDTVTVTFNNYSNAAVDLASGTLTVNVVNNAYHGAVLSGSLGKLRNAKIRGFTGVSLAMGNETDVVSGVTLPGLSNAFYWRVEVNVTSAAGWAMIVPPRNNANEFVYGTFPANFYNDSIPRRATCINQLVLGGLSNVFHRISLETNASEEAMLLLETANLNATSGPAYIEYNTSWATPPFPRVRAFPFSSANRMYFRHPYNGHAIIDGGTGNDLAIMPAASINNSQLLPVRLGRNIVTNGDFENGLTSWSDFSTGGAFAVTGTGALSGRRARIDLVAGKPNVTQTIDVASGISIAGLIGQNITCAAFIKTNLAGVKPRLNGATGNTGTVGDSTDEPISITYMVPAGTASLPLAIITDASGLTGFVEVSNVTCYLGTQAGGISERTQPVGSTVFNPPSIAAAGQTTTTVTVPGAALGDFALCSFSLDLQAVGLNGYVSAADTVTCLFKNGTAGAVDLASGTLRARVLKQ